MIKTFEDVTGMPVPYQVEDCRSGDVGVSYADQQKAQRELGWSARNSIREMCSSMWNWERNNR